MKYSYYKSIVFIRSFVSVFLLLLLSVGNAHEEYSIEVKTFIGCNDSLVEYKKLSKQKRTAVCNCALEKLDNNDWSSEEKCLLTNLSEEDGLLEKCNVEGKEGEIKIFRPFLEKLIDLSNSCYKETTGESLYPPPRS